MNKSEENKSIISTIWDFMNKSPILSTVLISFIAILGSQMYKMYTYIYWLPYFKLFKVPAYYFENALFDKYELLLKIAPKVIIILLLYVIFDFLERESKIVIKLGIMKATILDVSIMFLILFVSTILSVTKIIFSIYWLSYILSYIGDTITLLAIKKIVSILFSSQNIKNKFSLFTVATLIFIVISCGTVYIEGYNSNVVDILILESRTIADDKFIVFETEEQYYVVAYKKNEDGTIKVYRDSYGFIDKKNQSVTKNHYTEIYNEYDLSINDAAWNFGIIEW